MTEDDTKTDRSQQVVRHSRFVIGARKHSDGEVMATALVDKDRSQEIRRIALEELGFSRVINIVPILPDEDKGIYGCVNSFVYAADVDGPAAALIFKFGRYREIGYGAEEKFTQIVAEHTDIPVPHILYVNYPKDPNQMPVLVSKRGEGINFEYLRRTEPPEAVAKMKEIIGMCAAKVRTIKKPTEEPLSARILAGLERLPVFGVIGMVHVESSVIDSMKRFVEQHKGELDVEEDSLLDFGFEYHFKKVNGEWYLSFVCDLAETRYGHPYDGMPIATSLADLDPKTGLPFFRGYQSITPLDAASYLRIRPLLDLGAMCANLTWVAVKFVEGIGSANEVLTEGRSDEERAAWRKHYGAIWDYYQIRREELATWLNQYLALYE